MSSSLAEGDSFKEILVRARRGPPSDISTLAGHIHEQYRAHGRAILDAISKNLEIPTQVEGFEANHRQLSAAVSSFLCLVKVARWYIANPNESGHPVGPTALISDELCEKYLFWALRMLGIPASPTSLNPSLQFLTPHILRTLYHHSTAFFDILFKVPSVTLRALSSSMKSVMLDVAIAWWTSLIDGEPPIYPLRQRENPDPNAASTVSFP